MFGSFSRLGALLLAFTILAPALATAQTEPVQFMISGTVEDDTQAPLDRAQILVYRQGTDEILAQRIFTGPDGSFSATFQADVVPNVRLDDPTLPSTPHFNGYWMGDIWPNPYTDTAGRGATLPFAAPANTPRPDLEIFDARGRRIPSGDLMASGVYFYRLRFEGRITDARKLVILSPTRIQPELQRVAGPTKTWDAPQEAVAARRAEGELSVEVLVIKDGYVGQTQASLFDSRLQNAIDATLSAAPIPTAQLSVGGTLTEGSAVTFDGIGSTDPDGGALTYSWDFGDGVRGGGELVAHVYGAAGTYDVELTVSTSHGATATTTQQINVAALTPASTGATAVGTIRDAVGNLLEGVTVQQVGGAASGVSDATGQVTVSGLPTDVPVTLACTLPGFTKQVVRLELPANTVNTEFDATLRRQRAAVEIASIEDGGDVGGEDGVIVELPADALLRPNGTAASGKANVRLTPVDVSSEIEAAAFPGTYTGVRTDGTDGLLLSYGVAEFVIEQGGEELQLKPGSTAFIEIPVYTPGAAVDDVIPLWSVDETTGLWIEEGSGTVVANADSPTGLALRAEVTHFSWWNADAFDDDPYRVIPECKIKDQNGLPTLQIPPGESCYINGVAGAGGPTTRPSASIGPNNARLLALPAGVGVALNARAQNGTKVGSVIVNGASGVIDNVDIVLEELNPVPNELVLPADFESAIDPVGEVDTYTFDAQIGQDFGLLVTRNDGSILEGTIRVLDPDDQEIFSEAFGALSASFTHIVTVPGTYTIEIDGTANEPGGYRLSVQYIEVFSGSLPLAIDVDTAPGKVQMARVSMEAGTWFNVNYVRREAITNGRNGILTVVSPSGVQLRQINFGGFYLDSGLLEATETGDYLVILQSDDIEATIGLWIRDVPEIQIGGIAQGSLEERATKYFRFAAQQDDFLRATLDHTTGFSGGVSLVGGNNSPLNGSWLYYLEDGSAATAMPSTGDFFVKLEATHSTLRTTRNYRIALNRILEPDPLSFDTQGRAQVNGGQIGLIGDARLYTFAGSTGDAVVVELAPGDVTSLTRNADVSLYRLGSSDWTSPQSSVQEVSLITDTGDEAVGVLDFRGFVLPDDATYVLLVHSRSSEDGAFDLVVDRVAAQASLTVDDDLVQCPDADTRSLHGALLAAPPGGTVNVCAGTYSGRSTHYIANADVSVVGSGRDDVIVNLANRGFVMYATNNPARIANLTLQTDVGTNTTGLYLRQAAGTVLEDLRIAAVSNLLEHGITLSGSSTANLTVQRVRFESCERNVEGQGSNLLIQDNVFDGGWQILELQGDATSVLNNTWNVTGIGEAIDLQNGAGHQVIGNVIDIATPDTGAPARTFALNVEDADELDALPQTVIRGNIINTNEAGMYVAVDHAGSAMLVEQNLVTMVEDRGQTALETINLRDVGNDITVQNNVFVNTSSWRAIHLRWPERAGLVKVWNNSIKVDPLNLTNNDYPTVRIELGSGGVAGAFPVEFKNNVMQGIGGGTVGFEIPVGGTIDSDYNVLHNYADWYINGSTSSGTNDLLGVDPLFTNEALELDPTSPAVDSGLATGAPSVDFDGTSRPQGAGVDRGAYEQ